MLGAADGTAKDSGLLEQPLDCAPGSHLSLKESYKQRGFRGRNLVWNLVYGGTRLQQRNLRGIRRLYLSYLVTLVYITVIGTLPSSFSVFDRRTTSESSSCGHVLCSDTGDRRTFKACRTKRPLEPQASNDRRRYVSNQDRGRLGRAQVSNPHHSTLEKGFV